MELRRAGPRVAPGPEHANAHPGAGIARDLAAGEERRSPVVDAPNQHLPGPVARHGQIARAEVARIALFEGHLGEGIHRRCVGRTAGRLPALGQRPVAEPEAGPRRRAVHLYLDPVEVAERVPVPRGQHQIDVGEDRVVVAARAQSAQRERETEGLRRYFKGH